MAPYEATLIDGNVSVVQEFSVAQIRAIITRANGATISSMTVWEATRANTTNNMELRQMLDHAHRVTAGVQANKIWPATLN